MKKNISFIIYLLFICTALSSDFDTILFQKQILIRDSFLIQAKKASEFLKEEIALEFPYLDKAAKAKGTFNSSIYKNNYSNIFAELENNRKKLEPFRQKAEKLFKAGKKNLDSEELEEGKVYGESISARRLAVILDNSGSMEKYLPKIVKNIRKNFKKPLFQIENGCSLVKSEVANTYIKFINKPYDSSTNPFMNLFEGEINSKSFGRATYWIDTFGLLKTYITIHEVDTIYWFCDLKDKMDDDVINELAKLVKINKVKLYVHIPQKIRVNPLFLKLIKDSGGELIIKRP